jgi:thiol-disulfide isomerase/thioredoxin
LKQNDNNGVHIEIHKLNFIGTIMKKVLLLLLILLTVSCACSVDTEKLRSMPSWQLADVNGVMHKFPETDNKNTMVLFWATWCPFCKKLMPHIQSILYQYGDELNLQVYAMNIFEDSDANKYLIDKGYDFLLFPEAEEVAKLYGVQGTPALFIFDAKGNLIFDLMQVNLDKVKLDEKDSNTQKASQIAPIWAAAARQALLEKLD